ncbi:MAG: hypothetical protein ACRDZU_05860 [Acidimicrobiales bacterium]
MVLAAYGDTLWKLLFLGHIVAIVVAFAPAATSPFLAARSSNDGESEQIRVAGYLAANARQIHFPALIAVGGFGILLVVQSGYDFDQAWVSLAILVWLAIGGVVSGVIMPAERRVAAGDLAAEPRIAVGGQIVTVLLLAMLYLMIWKPGL